MSPTARFLECRDCRITFNFPNGAQFGSIAKQFESHLCGSPIGNPGWRTERGFVIIQYEGEVPVVAACAKCQLKFFAPATFAGNPEGAEEFLACKFDVHGCSAETEVIDRPTEPAT